MKRLILITGDLATGKSTLAGILSRRYSCPAFYKDKVKELLADSIGFSTREENMRLSVAAVELMIHAFEEISANGGDLILEANFKEDELKKIDKLAGEKEYSTMTLVLRADMDVIYKRFVNRIENENRHPAHQSGFTGYESLKFYIDKGREYACFGEHLEILADDFSYQTDENILGRIDEFMSKKNESN